MNITFNVEKLAKLMESIFAKARVDHGNFEMFLVENPHSIDFRPKNVRSRQFGLYDVTDTILMTFKRWQISTLVKMVSSSMMRNNIVTIRQRFPHHVARRNANFWLFFTEILSEFRTQNDISFRKWMFLTKSSRLNPGRF